MKIDKKVDDREYCNESVYWIHQKIPQTVIIDQAKKCLINKYADGFQVKE